MIEWKKNEDSSKDLKQLLHPIVKKWFFSKFKEFSPPQKFGIMEVHSRINVLISAPTGSGKTLTSFLAILNELVDSAEKGVIEDKIYCLYVSPLKALNKDIFHNLIQPLKEMEEIAGRSFGIRVGVRTGDTTAYEKQKMAKNPPHILITTPESLAIMLSTTKFSANFHTVEWTIIDEIHSIAENKRGVHLALSVERLQRLSPGICRVGLSATVAPLEEVAKFLVGHKRKCKIVDVQFIKKMELEVLTPVPDLINTNHEEIQNQMYNLIDNLIQNHRTTLIFTNTRAGTERIVHHLKEKFPRKYYEVTDNPDEGTPLIGAHHGSLSKEHREQLEDDLRAGKMKAVVCSTSLELGMDIGFIDLVICLGSPKSVARLLQRVGRAGHKLHETVKGKIIVTDRDDLVECSVMLKQAIEKKIDKIHIPVGALDVLAQQMLGMCLTRPWDTNDMYEVIANSYCYKDLSKKDFIEILDYLAGTFISLEDRHVYPKIWWDKEQNLVGKRGKMTRVIYMTNLGTIPDSQGILVKNQRGQKLGMLDEGFLEKLDRGDVFVLGGNTYRFNYARGMVAQVTPVPGKRPTVPSWYSQRLPLSFDLGKAIQNFRFLMNEKFNSKKSEKEIIEFVKEYLYLNYDAATALVTYFKAQYDYVGIPHKKEILVEHYRDEQMNNYVVFHTTYGRRVNDALSRSVAWAILKSQRQNVEIGINDNGFYVSYQKKVDVMKAFGLVKENEFRKVLELAVDRSETLKRRFRHCAGRALMILRTYKGVRKRVGRQQVSSMILLNAVRQLSNDFFVLREARREILEDLMDVQGAHSIIKDIESKAVKIKEVNTFIPSPFALALVLQGYSEILRVDDKQKYLQKMSYMVSAKIALKKGRRR
jgi:ATP-dependent helicase Lhr and Lhr-like helicase